jgi:hypothetical protein
MTLDNLNPPYISQISNQYGQWEDYYKAKRMENETKSSSLGEGFEHMEEKGGGVHERGIWRITLARLFC